MRSTHFDCIEAARQYRRLPRRESRMEAPNTSLVGRRSLHQPSKIEEGSRPEASSDEKLSRQYWIWSGSMDLLVLPVAA